MKVIGELWLLIEDNGEITMKGQIDLGIMGYADIHVIPCRDSKENEPTHKIMVGSISMTGFVR